jgi:hypothetical protein
LRRKRWRERGREGLVRVFEQEGQDRQAPIYAGGPGALWGSQRCHGGLRI